MGLISGWDEIYSSPVITPGHFWCSPSLLWNGLCSRISFFWGKMIDVCVCVCVCSFLYISYNKTNHMHWFLKFIFGMKLYTFRSVPLSTIRSFSLYTQQWYMSYRFADSRPQICMTYYACFRFVQCVVSDCRLFFGAINMGLTFCSVWAG
jgi:hypothetical protein